MKVIFSHGKESGPWGTKIKLLAEIAKLQGFDVDSIDYSGIDDSDQRVQKLRHIINNESERNIVLVGSSMGGYVSLIASESKNVKALFLLAPALYMPIYDIQQYVYRDILIEIIHGWSDDIIPVEHSIKFAKKHHHCLHLIDGDHRLNNSLDIVSALFKQFLEKTKSC